MFLIPFMVQYVYLGKIIFTGKKNQLFTKIISSVAIDIKINVDFKMFLNCLFH